MNLERAIEIAVEAHKGTLDKGGSPYVLHPLRMMFAVSHEEEKIVAVLHDVVEDAIGWEFERLEKEGFSAEVIDALRSVTKITEDEDYDAFIERAMTNPIGRQVKIADLRDNLDVTRIGELAERDMKRLNKYKKALARLAGNL
ncbi:MAG: GTP pyrophosphokinase [Gammaproteobacteria bacterium]|jgi:(p)ppGpp synthase/HD superfamily hydrolase|nr:GTP pyrophosphokinase [Gammaproteobacteria bacterium]